jgi:UV DNA damage repair endonuclease
MVIRTWQEISFEKKVNMSQASEGKREKEAKRKWKQFFFHIAPVKEKIVFIVLRGKW